MMSNFSFQYSESVLILYQIFDYEQNMTYLEYLFRTLTSVLLHFDIWTIFLTLFFNLISFLVSFNHLFVHISINYEWF